jgi:hypothetical protein
MAQLNAQVLAMVRREIEKDPAVTNDVLREKAASIDRSVKKMNGRQFHGSYRLTAARAVALGGGRTTKAKTKPPRTQRRAPVEREAARDAVRDARAAESRSNSPEASNADRSAIRGTLLEFAGEVAKAVSKADMIGVLGSMDRYVDRLVAAASHGRTRT